MPNCVFSFLFGRWLKYGNISPRQERAGACSVKQIDFVKCNYRILRTLLSIYDLTLTRLNIGHHLIMVVCKNCLSEIYDNQEKCFTCGWYAGPPNMRAAERQEETDALETRYNKAIEDARANGSEQALASFDGNMKMTCAVINVDLDFLNQFVADDNLMYSTYSLSVRGEIRKPAKGRDDRHRETIGAMMYGHRAAGIRYAAMSLDGSGLHSFGPYAIKLREVAIIERATILEGNSYHFISKHNIRPGEDIPPGYKAAWRQRHKLAVAKLAGQISAGTTEQEHSKILLFSEGDRATDEFIEVHIYGGFDNKAIESVKGSSTAGGRYERATLSKIKDYLKRAGKAWVEE